MARGRLRSTPRDPGFGVLLIIVGCASFGLGMLNPALRSQSAAALAPQVKTEMRALADGKDLGQLAWVGLNDPSIDQGAQLVQRLAKPMRFARNEGAY